MYHHFRGVLVKKTASAIVIEAGGVGYLLKIPFSTYEKLPAVGSDDTLVYSHFSVSENNQSLYGFATEKERDVFVALTKISGIGPATAVSALSGASADDVLDAVLRADVVFLKKIKGIGAKTAQRIILEMRGNLSEEMMADITATGVPLTPPTSGASATDEMFPANLRDAVDGIMGLFALKADKARSVVKKAAKSIGVDAAPADLIRAAIKQLR